MLKPLLGWLWMNNKINCILSYVFTNFMTTEKGEGLKGDTDASILDGVKIVQI
jgi:hypothetical protein